MEAGALDGEAMSVTLPFEMRQQWTGLLVEPNGIMYKKLLTKNRKSWSANFCLSPHTFPSMVRLVIRSCLLLLLFIFPIILDRRLYICATPHYVIFCNCLVHIQSTNYMSTTQP